MRSNITTVTWVGDSTTGHGAELWQWDYGQQLQFEGLMLREFTEVHFATTRSAETITQIAEWGLVSIPDELMQYAGTLTVYLYLHTGESDGETVYKASLLIKGRPKPSDYQPSEVQQDAITETIAALNSAVERAETAAEEAEAAAEEAGTAAEGLEDALALYASLGLSVVDGELCQTYEEG